MGHLVKTLPVSSEKVIENPAEEDEYPAPSAHLLRALGHPWGSHPEPPFWAALHRWLSPQLIAQEKAWVCAAFSP